VCLQHGHNMAVQEESVMVVVASADLEGPVVSSAPRSCLLLVVQYRNSFSKAESTYPMLLSHSSHARYSIGCRSEFASGLCCLPPRPTETFGIVSPASFSLQKGNKGTYAFTAVCTSQALLLSTRTAALRSIWVKLMNWLMAAFCCGVYTGGISGQRP
jgi:hypothetical protein